ncbi:hypothetical protein HMI55_003282, partial [Coelomomyces lativittatus]
SKNRLSLHLMLYFQAIHKAQKLALKAFAAYVKRQSATLNIFQFAIFFLYMYSKPSKRAITLKAMCLNYLH